MELKKLKVGEYVKIKYLDHSGINSMPIEAFRNWKGVYLTDIGKIEAINENYIILSQTITEKIEGETEYEGSAVLKSDIVKITILSEMEDTMKNDK